MNQKYKCPECGWIGTEDEMEADAYGENVSDEIWSNWICPNCKRYLELEDYKRIEK